MSTVNYNDTVPAAPANYNNIKWQSDTSGNISAYDPGGAWQSWTPTLTGDSGMTVSAVTVNVAEYVRSGAVCFIRFNIALTIGGTTAPGLNMTLPLAQTGTVGVASPVAGYSTTGLGTWAVVYATLPGAGTQIKMYAGGNDTTNWSTGTHQIAGHVFYRCA